jgi:hypothetical protein
MAPLLFRVLTMAMLVYGIERAAAQESFVRSPAPARLPSGRTIEVPGPDATYRHFSSEQEQAETLGFIMEKLREAQRALKELDRAQTVAAAAADPAAPRISGAEDPRRANALRSVETWEKKEKQYTKEAICSVKADTVDVELYDESLGHGPPRTFVDQYQPATGLLKWKNELESKFPYPNDAGNVNGMNWCSGTLFDKKFFLTAGHCFEVNGVYKNYITPARRVGNKMVSLERSELAPLMEVAFNCQRDGTRCSDPKDPRTCMMRARRTYPVVHLVEHGSDRPGHDNTELDYAVAELGPGPDASLPGAYYRNAQIDSSVETLTKASVLTIIQHPNGEPKKLAAGVHLSLGATSIDYSDVDTLYGSSGAGVLNQLGQVIAVHTEGGCDNPALRRNRGVTLNAVRQVSNPIR